MTDRIEPEDIDLLRQQHLDLSDVRVLRQIDKIDHTVTQMTKVWEQIQASLRNPWKQDDRRATRNEGRR
jgi:hypothetical protein